MGSVYDNKVDLKVENKVIAKGGLVIINDRYGVRIDEIFEDENKSSKETSYEDTLESDESPNEEEDEQITNEQTDSQNPEEQENNESEEFNYNDFEVDDENI